MTGGNVSLMRPSGSLNAKWVADKPRLLATTPYLQPHLLKLNLRPRGVEALREQASAKPASPNPCSEPWTPLLHPYLIPYQYQLWME